LFKLGGPYVIGVVLAPLNARLLPVTAQLQPVFAPDSVLACPKHALGAALEPQHHVDIVIELSAMNERIQTSGNGLGFAPGHEAGQIESVGTDITDTPACPGF